MSITLITGGLGFIGSHTSLKLLEKGFDLLIIDSLINTSTKVIKDINNILKNSSVHKKEK